MKTHIEYRASLPFQMTIKVKLSVEKVEPHKDFKKILELAKTSGQKEEDIKKCIPTGQQYTVKCILSNTFTGLANAINRCLRDEMPIKGMEVAHESIKTMLDTRDVYILSDRIQLYIKSVPINQDLDYKDITLSLQIRNKTELPMTLYTRDLKINKKLSAPMFSENIKIGQLSPKKALMINDIKVTVGMNKDDGAQYSAFENLNYWPIVPETKGHVRDTLSTDPTTFEINYTTYRHSTSKPKRYMVLACDTLMDRLSNILKDMKPVDLRKDNTYASEMLNIIEKNSVYEFRFTNEYFTIANMLADACILEDPDILFATAALDHPSIEVGVVKIKHTEPVKLMCNAIDRCLKDLLVVKKAFFLGIKEKESK